MHIEGVKAGLREGVGHFHMGVHALLAQDGDRRAAQQHRRGLGQHGLHRLGQVNMQARIVRAPCGSMFGIRARRVVAPLANFPRDAVPDLLQVFQRRAENRAGIAPDLQHAFAVIDGAALRPGGADDVAVLRQTVCTQDLHHRRFVGAAHLQHHAQLFVKQSLQRALFAPRADLGRPVFAVAHVHAAVGHAVAIDEQHVHIQGHAHAPGKGHLSHGGQ